MKMFRFAFVAVLILTAGRANLALAQDFPQRPIHLIIAFGPGGGSDIIGRILAESLQTKLGQAWWSKTNPAPAVSWEMTWSRELLPTATRLES